MTIKLSQLKTRTVKAKFVFMDEGEQKEEDIRVTYNTLTDDLRTQVFGVDKEAKITAREQFLLLVKELPDIVDDDGKPVELTDEFVRTKISTDNMIGIIEAVLADASPKQKS